MNLRKVSEKFMNFQDFSENLRITEIYLIFIILKDFCAPTEGLTHQEHSQAAGSFQEYWNKNLSNFRK
jgi:hypothetical protein